MGLDRFDAIVSEYLGLLVDPEHERNVGTINVGVEQTDLVSELSHGKRQIHRERSLSDSALTGTDCDNRFHAGKRLRALRRLSGTRRHRCIQEITFQIGGWMGRAYSYNYTGATSGQ